MSMNLFYNLNTFSQIKHTVPEITSCLFKTTAIFSANYVANPSPDSHMLETAAYWLRHVDAPLVFIP